MNWNTLYEMQKELDTYIVTNHQLAGKNLFNKKYLALLVELGELANETRSFKFWSTKKTTDISVILEEYVDGLHFILSLGLDKGYYYNGEIGEYETTNSETEQFNCLFAQCTLFKREPTAENYDLLFSCFLQLGRLLGFSEKEIQTAYYEKNKVNFTRQDEGY